MAPLAALVAMDGSDTPPASCLVAVALGTPASLRRPPTPAALAAWATAWRLRVGGRPIAVGREPARGPRLSALVPDDVWGLSPMHPITRATSRAACSPSRAQADPPDADDRRARLVHPRDWRKAWRPEHAKPRPRPSLGASRRRVVPDRTRLSPRLTAVLHADGPPG
jgi:hypothetical protein